MRQTYNGQHAREKIMKQKRECAEATCPLLKDVKQTTNCLSLGKLPEFGKCKTDTWWVAAFADLPTTSADDEIRQRDLSLYERTRRNILRNTNTSAQRKSV